MKKEYNLFRFWIGRERKYNDKTVLERTLALNWNEYQYLLRCLKEYHNNKWKAKND